MRGSSFSGGVGFSNAAWDEWGGRQFAPNAGQATREQQIVVAERIRASVGLGAWGCAKTLGLTRR
jgi:Transglycosylase-like domain